jgi:HD-GYP domain-containing protein (c-di-GMP phosphodiesterase class II)
MTPEIAALSKQRAITASQRDGSEPRKPNAASEDGPPFFSLDAEDIESPVHRVVALTLRIARAMGMRDEELMYVRAGAFLHDIGMVGVPDEILFKSDQLTDQEWKIVRRHPIYAYELLASIGTLIPVLDIPYCHHEKWDGTGYPRGLKGEEIPLAARIFAVVDVWCALQTARPHRPAWTAEEAREYVYHHAGIDFDPRVVEVFMTMDPEPQTLKAP